MVETPELLAKWESLTIRDNFIFGETMYEFPDLCRRLLEEILQIRIRKIEYLEREKSIESRLDAKGIRLDAYVEDPTANRVFDVEMQVADTDDLPKRVRYYQSLIDQDRLKRGQHYDKLGESYIIFICLFDLFRADRYMYTFKEMCVEDSRIALGDGATKIFLNTKGRVGDVSQELKSFLEYVESKTISGKLVRDFDDAIRNVKSNERKKVSFMTLEDAMMERQMLGYNEGIERGRSQGISLGRSQGISLGRSQGISQGISQERESIAKTLIQMGKTLEEIHAITKLPVESIRKLIESLH